MLAGNNSHQIIAGDQGAFCEGLSLPRTFDEVDRLTETLLPRVKLSKAQVVDKLVKSSHDSILTKKEDHEETEKQTQ